MTDFTSSQQEILPEFRVGAVVTDTFKTMYANLFKFVGIGLIIYVPFYGIMFLTMPQIEPGNQVTDPAGLMYTMFGTMFLMMLAGFIAQTAIVHASIETLAGKSATFGDMLSTAVQKFLPVVGASIIIMLLYMVGAIFLVVPGIIALLMLCVTIPVIVAEDKPVFEALKRSAELTKGSKWAIIGATMLTFIAAYILMIVILLAIGLLSAVAGPVGAIIGGIAAAVMMAAMYGIMGAVVAAIYTNLRIAKEGVSADDIAKVFA